MDNQQQAENTSITSWFNHLPIRIIGDNITPYFYAQDIGSILGIKNVRTSLQKFTEYEIVSRELRESKGLVTYYKYKDELRRDDSIILLTEPGVYRLVMRSRLLVAEQLKEHIYKAVLNARLAEQQKLNILIDENNNMKEAFRNADKMREELDAHKKHNPIWYVFETKINDDPYKHVDKCDMNPDGIGQDPCEYLYLYTMNTRATDFNKKLVAKLFGFPDDIRDGIAEESLTTNPSSMSERIYSPEDPGTAFDSIDSVKVEWIY